uniref:Uncharacterized protein n=1 Tax=Arundo donax TaxID=35708 RepID=A0A0A9CYA7_ARUDO
MLQHLLKKFDHPVDQPVLAEEINKYIECHIIQGATFLKHLGQQLLSFLPPLRTAQALQHSVVANHIGL